MIGFALAPDFDISNYPAGGENCQAYLCGPTGARIKCVAALPGVEDPEWEIFLDDNSRHFAGALVPGMLYISTENGFLYALSPDEAGAP